MDKLISESLKMNSIFNEIKIIIGSYSKTSDFKNIQLHLKKLLNFIVLNQELTRNIASNSYKHQLGFDKFTLHTFTDGSSLRLHFWNNSIDMKEDIHSHCSDFKSIILNGGLKNNIYELTNGTDRKVFNYSLDKQTETMIAGHIGDSGYKIIDSTFLNTSNFYTQASHFLHNISHIQQNTITISLWEKRESSALVLKEQGSSAEDCNCSNSFSESEMKHKFNLILEIF